MFTILRQEDFIAFCKKSVEWVRQVIYTLGGTSGTTPGVVSGLDHIIAISSEGGTQSLALKSDGTVWAWDAYGAPAQVAGLDHVIAIQGRYASAYALKSDGTVWAWGQNSNGELGDGTTTARTEPVQVIGLSHIVYPYGQHARNGINKCGYGICLGFQPNGSDRRRNEYEPTGFRSSPRLIPYEDDQRWGL
ncbi:hypothetical protein [Paenibacillus sp. RC67]|uniref:RCC1 domain-containing protein n=1 Tax=Paenibacillus sp. RC67 TaxID=3039392 RepID=UPI0024AC8273|nr:hypothetical protein [Paenibacillus sp. RC67]